MVYNILLERRRRGYKATVQGLPEVAGSGTTREETLASVCAALEERLSDVEVVPMEVDLPDAATGYSAAARVLAADTVRKGGGSPAELTGKPWVDLAGYLADLPGEYWDAYDAELKAIREGAEAQEPAP